MISIIALVASAVVVALFALAAVGAHHLSEQARHRKRCRRHYMHTPSYVTRREHFSR